MTAADDRIAAAENRVTGCQQLRFPTNTHSTPFGKK
jgi:hypothetical protein